MRIDMYAIVDVKGKQYKVEQDKLIKVDKIDAEPGANLEFDTVMLFSDQEVKVGAPYIAGAKVKAVVENHVKGKKLIVFKYKSKKNYRRTYGHRQQYTTLRVKEIVGV